MASAQHPRPPNGLGRVSSMSSSEGSDKFGKSGLVRSSTMSTASGSLRWASETSRSLFQDYLHEMAVVQNIPLALPRSMLSLPSQRVVPLHASDKAAAEEFLMSMRPKRVLLGKSSKGYARDEILLGLEKAVGGEKSVLIIEALLQLAASAGVTAGSSNTFTADKKGHAIPTLDYIFAQADQSRSLDIWRLFLCRVSQKALDASLMNALKNRSNDIERIKCLLEHGANPELCQDQILDLIATGAEQAVEILLLSPLLKDVEFLSHGLVKAARVTSLHNTCMLLLRGASANFGQAEALKAAISAQSYESALAIVTLSKSPISSSNLDDVTGMLGSWTREMQRPFLKILLYAGASGPRMSKALIPFITAQDQEIISNLIECPAFRHSTFPAPKLLKFAVDSKFHALALDILRSSNNRSFSDYVNVGVHLQLVKNFPTHAEECYKVISELLTLGVSGDYTSQMLVCCCAPEQIECPQILNLVNLLIRSGGAKASYSDGVALFSAIQEGHTEVVGALVTAKPTKKILGSAVSYTSSCLGDDNPAKKKIWSMLLEAGAAGVTVDQELISAVDKAPYALGKVNILLKGASIDYSDGAAIVKAVELKRLDILETVLSYKVPQFPTMIPIWKKIRKLFALVESKGDHLPYTVDYMEKVFDMLHSSVQGATPLNELLLDATQCSSRNVALILSRLFLRWGASPNHALGSSLSACVKRSDTKTLAALLAVEISKTSLKYGFMEALLLRNSSRHTTLEILIGAGLERSSLDAALPQVLKEVPYDETTVHLLVEAGARLNSSFGESLVPSSINLDLQVVERLLPTVIDKDCLLVPLKAVLHSHTDWRIPEGHSLRMVKLLVKNCNRGAWADDLFIAAVKSCNQHSAHIFANHLTSEIIYSDALQEFLMNGKTNLERTKLPMLEYLISKGARGKVIDEVFLLAAVALELEWLVMLHPHLSDSSIDVASFDLVLNKEEFGPNLDGKRLEIVQFLLKKGVQGSVVDEAFIKASSNTDLRGMTNFLPFVSSKDKISEALNLLAIQESVFRSTEGLAAVEMLINQGASEIAVKSAARAAAKARSLTAVRLITSIAPKSAVHAAFSGLMDKNEQLNSSASRSMLIYLLQAGLDREDNIQLARVAAVTHDVEILNALATLEHSAELYDSAAEAIALTDEAWLSSGGLQCVKYLLATDISISGIHKLIEIASKALHLPALQMLVTACEDRGKAASVAFNHVALSNKRWTSPDGLRAIDFLLENGAKGVAVDDAAAYAAKTSNYNALDMFLRSSAAATAIPSAFKAVTRSEPGSSGNQLTIAYTLVKQGVSTSILAIAAIEMAKLLDIEELEVLSRSTDFHQVSDDVLKTILMSEDLWRSPKGLRIAHFLLENGVSTKMITVLASKAAGLLDFHALCNVIHSKSPSAVIEAAFISMTELEKGWLCPEGLRIAEFLLQRNPSQASINKAFIQASQYLNFDATKLINNYVKDISVFGEALQRVVDTKSEWPSSLHIIRLLLESGVKGERVEYALIEGARAHNLDALDLLSSSINGPEIYTKAFIAATASTLKGPNYLPVLEFLLRQGAKGESVDAAYLLASKALDLQALRLLNSYIDNPETHSRAFNELTTNPSWLSPQHLEILDFLYSKNLDPLAVENALVVAAKALNFPAVSLLSRNANQDMCNKAFVEATGNTNWMSTEGSKIVQNLAQKGAHGESVDAAFITSCGLLRLDLVAVLAKNVRKENVNCVSRAFDAFVSSDGIDALNPAWLYAPDSIDLLKILVGIEANGELANANEALVKASQAGNIAAVDILSQVVADPQVYTEAFNAFTNSSSLWMNNDKLELVDTLLSRGASGEGINSALVKALTYVVDGQASQDLIELLLQYHADVDFDHGKSLQLAGYHGNQDLFEMLLKWNPNPHSLYMGLKAAMSNDIDEETVFRLFKSVTAHQTLRTKPDVNNLNDSGYPLIFYCLYNYPASVRLAKEICDLGADMSATILFEKNESEYDDFASDRITPLSVSLEKNCSDEVIDVLLAYGADINFTPEQSRASVLMLAAGKGRSSIVSTLIDRGASVFQRDSRDRTPLCYAARSGDVFSLKSILRKNPPRNDGSLHEAARELHAEAVTLLLESNHDINFPSSRHGGRSALCELCYACKGYKDPTGLQNTLTELHRSKAEPLRKSRGRTALFMAMENAHPVPVVTALIEACLWKDLNDPQNVYEEGDHFYSPTMYIKKGIIRQPEAVAKTLLEKLQDFSATDRYYAKERMQQPKDAVGMPQRILDYDHKKWIRSSRLEEEEEDFERKLKRQEQEMENRQLLSQRHHLMVLEQRENMGQQQSAHVLDNHILSMKLRDREHSARLMHQEEAYDRRLGEMASGSQVKLNIEAAQYATRFGIQKEAWDAHLLYENQAQEQKLGYLGKEQGVRYSGLEAQQNLRLEGISSVLELERQRQMDEVKFRELTSGVEQADLNHKLNITNQLISGRVQMNRDLSDVEVMTGQRKLLLENQNRASQQQHQFITDEQRLQNQMAMNQQEYARNQEYLDTYKAQGQIERETMYAKIQMTQQDRTHQLENEQRRGQIQNQILYNTFSLTQQDRNHRVQTEQAMGQVQNANLQGRLDLQFDNLRETNRERLGFQQATDYQQLSTLDTQGKIENANLRDQNYINLDYQHGSGNLRLGELAVAKRMELENEQQASNLRLAQDVQRKTIELNYQEQSGGLRLQQQAVGNEMEVRREGTVNQMRMGEYAAQDYLNARRVQGAMVIGQVQAEIEQRTPMAGQVQVSKQGQIEGGESSGGGRSRRGDSFRFKQLDEG